MSNALYSYLTIPEDAITIDWFIYGRQVHNQSEIRKWKKNEDLDFNLTISINDINEISKCVDETAELALYISWHSLYKTNGTALHDLARKEIFSYSQESLTTDIPIMNIPGNLIAGDLELTCTIVLNKDMNINERTLYATEKGTILFESTIHVYLEGKQALFPVKALDFRQNTAVAQKSLYYLSRKYTDLESNFNTSYLLTFNSSHPLFDAINSDTENEQGNSFLIKMIMFDVYKTIVFDALDDNYGLQEIELSPEDVYSLKAVYSRILNELIIRFFPGKDLTKLKQMAYGNEQNRNKLYTAIQEFILGD